MARDCVNDVDVKKSFQTIIEDTKKYAEDTKLDTEIDFHSFEWIQPWISAEESCPNVAAVDYTSFLLATAAGKVEGGKGPSGSWNPVETTKIPAYSICSITPCSRLYRFLWEEFSKAVDFTTNRYKQWIEMIFGSGDSNEPLGTEQILDKLAKSLTEEERDSLLGRLYYHGLSFEIEFFSAVSLYQRTSVPLLKQGVKSNCRYTITLSCTVLDSSKVSTKNPIKGLPSKKGGLDFNCAKSFSTNEFNGLTIFNNIESSIKAYGMQHININIGYDEDDLPSLLEADIGIVIGTNQMLKHVGENFGVCFDSLFSGLLKQEIAYAEGYTGWTKKSGTLYTVSSWSEICSFLVGYYN